jgi:hypothetical protein
MLNEERGHRVGGCGCWPERMTFFLLRVFGASRRRFIAMTWVGWCLVLFGVYLGIILLRAAVDFVKWFIDEFVREPKELQELRQRARERRRNRTSGPKCAPPPANQCAPPPANQDYHLPASISGHQQSPRGS